MHRCLQIQEILEIIIEDVIADGTRNRATRPDRRDLSSISKTCHTFSIPANKILWRDLDSLAPLILTMPDDLLDVEVTRQETQVAGRRITFRRSVQPEDWKRFDFYAPLVRHLGVIDIFNDGTKYGALGEEIYSELQKRNHPLLPNLQSMKSSTEELPTLQYLMCARPFRRLHLMMSCHPRAMLYPPLNDIFKDTIPTHAANLKSLILTPQIGSQFERYRIRVVSPGLLELLRALDLEEFYCNSIHLGNTHVEALMKMPSLRTATFLTSIPELCLELQRHPLPAHSVLRSVNIRTDNMGNDLSLARTLTSLPRNLEDFSIRPVQSIPECSLYGVQNVISAISEYCAPEHFKNLHIVGYIIDPDAMEFVDDIDLGPEGDVVMLFSAIQPLLSFSGIREVILVPFSLDVTDAEVKQLANAWPRLEVLDIDNKFSRGGSSPPRATVRSLLFFAMHCRELKILTLQFSYPENGISDELELGLAAGHGLQKLYVGDSVFHSSTKMVAFLKVVFPRVRLLWNRIVRHPNRDMWEDVKAKLVSI